MSIKPYYHSEFPICINSDYMCDEGLFLEYANKINKEEESWKLFLD